MRLRMLLRFASDSRFAGAQEETHATSSDVIDEILSGYIVPSMPDQIKR